MEANTRDINIREILSEQFERDQSQSTIYNFFVQNHLKKLNIHITFRDVHSVQALDSDATPKSPLTQILHITAITFSLPFSRVSHLI